MSQDDFEDLLSAFAPAEPNETHELRGQIDSLKQQLAARDTQLSQCNEKIGELKLKLQCEQYKNVRFVQSPCRSQPSPATPRVKTPPASKPAKPPKESKKRSSIETSKPRKKTKANNALSGVPVNAKRVLQHNDPRYNGKLVLVTEKNCAWYTIRFIEPGPTHNHTMQVRSSAFKVLPDITNRR